jgi:hypothetical protein
MASADEVCVDPDFDQSCSPYPCDTIRETCVTPCSETCAACAEACAADDVACTTQCAKPLLACAKRCSGSYAKCAAAEEKRWKACKTKCESSYDCRQKLPGGPFDDGYETKCPVPKECAEECGIHDRFVG